MSKIALPNNNKNNAKSKVVFNPKMPEYRFVQTGSHSLSVDRKRSETDKPQANCLSTISVK